MLLTICFWGKTFSAPDGCPAPNIYKPVLHHLIDVAAVAATRAIEGLLGREASSSRKD